MLVVCVPAYNEEGSIAKVVLRARKHADRVLVCDDGSADMTAEIASALGAEVIEHKRNMGYGAALSSLFRRALELGADVTVTLDGDGQHNPDDIPLLTAQLDGGAADVVIGSRLINGSKGFPGYREFGIRVITSLSNRVSNSELSDAQSGFRAYSRNALGTVMPGEMGMGASTEILAKALHAGLRVVEVPIPAVYSEQSSTHNPLYHGAEVLLSMVKYLSIRHTLLVYGVPGCLLFLVGLYYGFHALDAYTKTGFLFTGPTLLALAFSLVGLILLAVAVILWILVTITFEVRYRNFATQRSAEN